MECVFAFDRDDAVTSSEKTGPIPIEWVRYLAHETEHEVWAIGNQDLKAEADIPGIAEMLELYEDRWGDPKTHFEARSHPKVESIEGLPPDAPEPDIVSAVYYEAGHPTPRGMGSSLTRQQRVRLLGSLFPDHAKRIVIDNRYLGYLDDWTFFYPQEFVEFVESLEPLLGISLPDAPGIPDYYDWPDV